MTAEWRTQMLGDLTINHDNKRSPVKEADRRPGPYPYYGASGVVDYVDDYLIDGDYLLIAEDGENLRTRQMPIAFMARGKSWVNNHAHIVTGNDKGDTLFLMYALLATNVSGYLTGAVMPKLTQANLNKIPIKCPPSLDEQRAIAHILGTLDDKNELNRRMNETLEAIARAIFKSWFVDFDPVRAKASGEPPESICRRLGLTLELLAFFSDRLVDSELGEIPDAWEVKSLEQLTCYLSRGLSPKYIEDGGVLVLNQKCVRDGRVDLSKGRRHDPAQRRVDGRLLEMGDILVNSTGVGTLGRVAQVPCVDEPMIVDSHVTAVRADPEKVSWNYLGVALQGRETEIEALGEGSTGQTELSRVRLGSLAVLLPPKPLRDHFDGVVTSLRLCAKRNDGQNETLASLRDTLLPKLLSGEMRVPMKVQHE